MFSSVTSAGRPAKTGARAAPGSAVEGVLDGRAGRRCRGPRARRRRVGHAALRGVTRGHAEHRDTFACRAPRRRGTATSAESMPPDRPRCAGFEAALVQRNRGCRARAPPRARPGLRRLVDGGRRAPRCRRPRSPPRRPASVRPAAVGRGRPWSGRRRRGCRCRRRRFTYTAGQAARARDARRAARRRVRILPEVERGGREGDDQRRAFVGELLHGVDGVVQPGRGLALPPDVLADRDAHALAAERAHPPRGGGLEVARLVEHVVGRQQGLGLGEDHPSPATMEAAFTSRRPARPGCGRRSRPPVPRPRGGALQLPQALEVRLDERVVLEQVHRGIAAQAQLGEHREIAAFLPGAPGEGEDLRAVAREVADGGVDLAEGDAHLGMVAGMARRLKAAGGAAAARGTRVARIDRRSADGYHPGRMERIVLVSDADTPLGRELVRLFAARGHQVAALVGDARSPDFPGTRRACPARRRRGAAGRRPVPGPRCALRSTGSP